MPDHDKNPAPASKPQGASHIPDGDIPQSNKQPDNLEQKFNDDNFNEKEFEHSFHSQASQNGQKNNITQNDDYFTEEDLHFYTEKYKFEEKASKKVYKSKKIRWKEGEQLGIGSFGRVVLGFNKETGELMAVKQVHLAGFNTNTERIKALEVEFNLLSLLKHKNIVRYIGTTKNRETFNIFLEFVAGGSISSLLNKYGPFKENIVRLYTKQILEGLEYLHWNNVLHRDIKGANVLVDNNGVCKLADFGSAKKICGIYQSERYNSLSGTANWMAPEVIKQTGANRFADIWSVGCTVVEMLTGKPPFAEYRNPVSFEYFFLRPLYFDDINAERQVPRERFNARRLLNHPFMNGVMEVLFVQPTLDLTKEMENKILETFERKSKESEFSQNDGKEAPIQQFESPMMRPSLDFSLHIQEKQSVTILTNSVNEKSFEEKKETCNHLHLKEEQDKFSIDLENGHESLDNGDKTFGQVSSVSFKVKSRSDHKGHQNPEVLAVQKKDSDESNNLQKTILRHEKEVESEESVFYIENVKVEGN